MPPNSLDREFFQDANIDVVIPENGDADLEEMIEEGDEAAQAPGNASPLLRIRNRSLLFFDETLKLYVVLQLPHASAESLHARLSRLEIKVEVWVANQSSSNGGDPESTDPNVGNARDLVFSGQVEKSQDPVVIVKKDDDEDQDEDYTGGTSTLVLWETSISLHRPRVRFPNPVASIALYASVKPDILAQPAPGDEYLPSFVPLPTNVLEPLRILPGLEKNPPYLASSRLERVVPKAPISDSVLRIPQVLSNPVRVVPALIVRLRSSRPNASPLVSSTTASIEIEVVPFIQIQASLDRIAVDLEDGYVDDLVLLSLPLSCQSKDSIVFLYKLNPSRSKSRSLAALPNWGLPAIHNVGVLSVSLAMKIFLSPNCTPVICMDWTTKVDLPLPPDPPFAQGIPRPISPPPTDSTAASSRPPSSAINAPGQFASTTLSTGITITFTGPDSSIRVNQPFTCHVHVYNSSPQPARLAIVPLPRLQRAISSPSHRHAPKSSTASFHASERRHTHNPNDRDLDLAQAVCDDNVIYALHHSRPRPMETDLLSLTPELRIGPLGPGACHEADIKFVALRRGCLNVDCIRVVDLTREGMEEPTGKVVNNVVDVRELPVIWVE